MAFIVAPGQAHELPHATPLLDRCRVYRSGSRATVATPSHTFPQHIWERGSRAAIPSKRNETPVACPDGIYNNRNVVEMVWSQLTNSA